MSSPRRLIVYSRVSTEEQSRNGVSIDEQAARCARHCEQRGYVVAGVEREEGVSGSVLLEARPTFSRLLARLEAGEADGICFTRMDRLSRDLIDASLFRREATKRGWLLECVDEPFGEAEDPDASMIVSFKLALAERERKVIGLRVRRALEHLTREGRATSRFVPFGYRTASGGHTSQKGEKGKLVEFPEEMAILAQIRSLRTRGFGSWRIASSLRALDVRSPRTGRPLSWRSIESICVSMDRREKLKIGE